MIQRATSKRKARAEGPSVESPVQVAVYVRKSTTKGLDQRFTSLEAQQEAIQGYIQSRRSEGWVALPEVYSDAGFSGSNTDRPGFQRMIEDVQAGKINVVAVHRLDRLSRSQLDFIQTMDFLKRSGVAFVSVSESIDTSTSLGRMILHVLAVFAEFERERIADRTRDKLAAQRRRGLWVGGRPLLGYRIENKQLVVVEEEAERVRAIFKMYLETGAVRAVARECNRKGWKNKAYTNRAGKHYAGKPFTCASVQKLLNRPIYIGKVPDRDEVHDGVHEALVAQETWDAVHRLLKQNAKTRTVVHKNYEALLRGLLRCEVCGATMGHEVGNRTKGRGYRYYICGTIKQQGSAACPGSRVPAGEIEQFVLDKIRDVGRDPTVLEATLEAAKTEFDEDQPNRESALRDLGAERKRLLEQQSRLVEAVGDGDGAAKALIAKLESVEGRLGDIEVEMRQIRSDIAARQEETLDPAELRRALESFDEIWEVLCQQERVRILQLLIEQIAYNSQSRELAITFRPNGIRKLGEERHAGRTHDSVQV